MKAKVTSLVLVMLMMCTYVALPTFAAAQNGGNNPTRSLTVPVTGTADGNALTGLLKVTNFSNQNGKIFANGTLVASVTDTATGAVRNIVTPVSLPVNLPGSTSGAAATAQQTTADCGILHLDLGPLDLNLLGLNIHLNEVVLDITAQSGPGNLLGNLLCSVANLLNGGSPLSNVLNQITGLLNQILGAL